ncbi:MAG: CRISPR-associated endonuclease Cas1 [Bacteroidota bacterium]|nr:CRISPR-associated endonuclease Cas1 [Bacteroidota bacterium]
MEVILNTFGTSLVKDNETFLVIHKDGKQRLDPAKLKSIVLSKGAKISSDAALLAIEHEISVYFVDGLGKPQGRIWSNRYGSVSTIRKNQVDFAFSKKAIEWIKEILFAKIDNQIAIMLSFTPPGNVEEKLVEKNIRRLEDYKTKIKAIDGELISDISPTLRGWEGAASRIYFETINVFLSEKLRMHGRSQHPATDLPNCLLNYAYGVLYGKIESALIKAGIDPYLGVMHRDDYNRPVLVFDIIEKFRVWPDYVVFSLLMQDVINDDCYSIKNDGSFWLEALGKRILIQSLNDYLEEIIKMNSTDRSRATHIELFAQALAQKFLNFKTKNSSQSAVSSQQSAEL